MIVSYPTQKKAEGRDADCRAGLNNWLINAFNGEWLRTEHAVPYEKTGVAALVR